MKKLFTIFILLILFPLFYHQPSVKAHEVGESWLFVNQTKLEDNQIPNPSSLYWSSHIVSKSFEIGESVNLKLVEDVVKEKFEVEDFEAEFVIKNKREFSIIEGSTKLESKRLNDNFQAIQLSGIERTISFSNFGNYFIEIHLSSSDEIFESEEFMVVVGSAPEMAEFKINGDLYKNRDLLKIERSTPLLFEIQNPNFENFNYYLDLGEGDEFFLNDIENNSVKKSFLSSKLPLYVVLRKEDKQSGIFQDSYIRIDSDQESSYKVVTPSNPISDLQNSVGLPAIILAVVIVGFLGLATFAAIKFRKRSSIV